MNAWTCLFRPEGGWDDREDVELMADGRGAVERSRRLQPVVVVVVSLAVLIGPVQIAAYDRNMRRRFSGSLSLSALPVFIHAISFQENIIVRFHKSITTRSPSAATHQLFRLPAILSTWLLATRDGYDLCKYLDL